MSDAGYDSDDACQDQHFEKGDALEIRDHTQQWVNGKVNQKLGRLVEVRFPGAHMQDMNTWIMESSKRLAPAGTFVHLQPSRSF